jgi:hypothetical protein
MLETTHCIPALYCAPEGKGLTFIPLTRRPGGLQTYKVVIPATGRRVSRNCRSTKATNGFMSYPGDCASCSANTT